MADHINKILEALKQKYEFWAKEQGLIYAEPFVFLDQKLSEKNSVLHLGIEWERKYFRTIVMNRGKPPRALSVVVSFVVDERMRPDQTIEDYIRENQLTIYHLLLEEG